MKKYWHVIQVGIQNHLTYRFNFLARSLFGLIPLVAILQVWETIYGSKGPNASVGTYTLAEMITYYLLVAIVDALTSVNEDDWQIAADIKDGNISQFLLKPIDYLWYRLCLFASGRVAYLLVAAVPLALAVFWLRHYFTPPAGLPAAGGFFVAIVLTALLQFFMSYTMALLAFWVLEVSTFIFILFAFEYIASGHLFPLDILPPYLEKILYFTPFPYQLSFPINVYLGRVTGEGLIRGLLIQLAWVLAACALARFVWRKGIRHYAAVGG
jgi:ABC-2 type transport system permease protein